MVSTRLSIVDPTEILPTASTRDGFTYDPTGDEWVVVSNKKRTRFQFMLPGLHPAIMDGFKSFVANLLRSESIATAEEKYRFLRRLFMHVVDTDPTATAIGQIHLSSYRQSNHARRLTESTRLHTVVRQWSKLGIWGFAEDAVEFAREASRHHAPTGMAVRLRDPKKGPYTDLEYDGICKALHSAFARKDVDLQNYTLCLLSLTLGARAEQFASLKLKDLVVKPSEAGPRHVLRVPRTKAGRRFRRDFTDRPLNDEIGLVVGMQAERVRRAASAAGIDPEDAPLFPAVHDTALFYGDGSAPAHATPNSLGTRIRAVLERLGVNSERTGKTIHISATRARRTVATRAAMLGRSVGEIAALLDHDTTQTAMVYVELRSQMVEHLDRKLALHLAPLAQRFAGVAIMKGDDTAQGVVRHVLGPVGNELADVGGCGKAGFCGLGRPTACYTCRLFRPWIDGPHETMLGDLLARRERMDQEGSSQVASTLDDTILACAEVVRQCRLATPEPKAPSDD